MNVIEQIEREQFKESVSAALDRHAHGGGFSNDQLESARARHTLEAELALPPSGLAVVFHSDTLVAGQPAFEASAAVAVAAYGIAMFLFSFGGGKMRRRLRGGRSDAIIIDDAVKSSAIPQMLHKIGSAAAKPATKSRAKAKATAK